MPDGIVLKVKPDADKDAADDVKKFLQELIDWMVERWSLGAEEAARIAFQTVQQITEHVKKAGKQAVDQTTKITKEAFTDILTAVWEGQLDKIDDIIWRYKDKLENAFHKIGDLLAGNIIKTLADGLSKISAELITKPLNDLIGHILDKLLEPIKKGIIEPLKEAFQSFLAWLGEALKELLGSDLFGGIFDWLGDLVGLSGGKGKGGGAGSLGAGLAAGAGKLLGLGGGATAGVGAGASGAVSISLGGGAAGAGGLGAGATGLAADWAGINAEISAGLESTLATGLLASPLGLMGVAAAPIAVGAVFGDTINSLFGWSGGFTRETAREQIAADLAYMSRAGQIGGVAVDAESFRRAADEIARLADIAQYTKEELDQMVDRLGQSGAAMVEAAQGAEAADSLVESLATQLANLDEYGMPNLEALREGLMQLTESLGLPTEATRTLAGEVEALVQRFGEGQLSIQELAAAYADTLQGVLMDLVESGQLSAEQARAWSDALSQAGISLNALGQAVVGLPEGLNLLAQAAGGAQEKVAMLDAAAASLALGSGERIPVVNGLAQALGGGLRGAADSATAALEGVVGVLAGEGGLTTTLQGAAQQVGGKGGLLTELGSLGRQASASGKQVAELSRWIESLRSRELKIVTHIWRIHHEVQAGGQSRHQGGLVYHTGGVVDLPRYHAGSLVSRLAHDEVPIIARRGEFVVRAESVSAQTLPWLQALNQTGRLPQPQSSPSVQVNGPLVQIQGGFFGDQDQKEELVRELEAALHDLAEGRFSA